MSICRQNISVELSPIRDMLSNILVKYTKTHRFNQIEQLVFP